MFKNQRIGQNEYQEYSARSDITYLLMYFRFYFINIKRLSKITYKIKFHKYKKIIKNNLQNKNVCNFYH